MATYDMGFFIRQTRTERKITQLQLCSGLCEITTLSRIERGLYTPSSYLFRALIERLGYYSDKYQCNFLGKDDFALWQSRESLKLAIGQGRIPDAEALFSELEQKKEFKAGLGLQFILNSKIALAINKEKDHADFNECMSILRKAITITLPDFDENLIGNYMLSVEEIRSVNLMGGMYYYNNDYKASVRILSALKNSLDKFCLDTFEKANQYPRVLANLCALLCVDGRYEESMTLCLYARDFCIKHDVVYIVPNLFETYGECLFRTGDTDKAKSVLRETYYSARILGQLYVYNNIEKSFYEKFNEKLESVLLVDNKPTYDYNFSKTDYATDHETDHETDHITDHMSSHTDVYKDQHAAERIKRLLHVLGDEALSANEIMRRLDLRHKPTFRVNYLSMAISSGLVEMTIPDHPKDKCQKYRAAKHKDSKLEPVFKSV